MHLFCCFRCSASPKRWTDCSLKSDKPLPGGCQHTARTLTEHKSANANDHQKPRKSLRWKRIHSHEMTLVAFRWSVLAFKYQSTRNKVRGSRDKTNRNVFSITKWLTLKKKKLRGQVLRRCKGRRRIFAKKVWRYLTNVTCNSSY